MLEHTQSVVHRLAGIALESADGERRAWGRFATDRETTIRATANGAAPVTARIEDVSGGGVRLTVADRFEPGDMIQVDLPLNGEHATAVLACVVHAKPEPAGGWSLGCSFATEIGDRDLESLGAERVRPPDTDQRAWERHSVRGFAVITPARTLGATSQTAAIHNISPTGVALWLTHPAEPGALFHLQLRSEAGVAVLTILGCVVYLSEYGEGRWLAGCNFIRELDDQELRNLL